VTSIHVWFSKAACLAAAVCATALTAQANPQLERRQPAYLKHTWAAAMKVHPMPYGTFAVQRPNLPMSQTYLNATGLLGVWQADGPVSTRNHPFFQSLGTNGRSCATCHQPESAMSLSTGFIRYRWLATGGRDPLFAPVDGANCPNQVKATSSAAPRSRFHPVPRPSRDAHSLLLDRGLFRVFLPVPKTADFTVSVVSDPHGCNTDPAYATRVDESTGEKTQMVSVYRRPRMSANLKFMTVPALTLGPEAPLPNIDMVTGQPVVNPKTGLPISGNIMWDGREPTLESQAISATLGHAQATRPPTDEQVAQIVAFENSVFAAQTVDFRAGDLTPTHGATATGGPRYLSTQPVAFGSFTTYDAWNGSRTRQRAAIARGQALFNNREFQVDNVAGFNNAAVLNVTNPTRTTCASCHGGLHVGSDPFPAGQRDIGIGGQGASLGGPALTKDLPIFKVTCKAPATTAFLGTEVLTNDPGMALITGKCADVGRKSVPQLRAMAARAPFFSDGSAATTHDAVRVYNKRFNMGLSATDINDLASFLNAL